MELEVYTQPLDYDRITVQNVSSSNLADVLQRAPIPEPGFGRVIFELGNESGYLVGAAAELVPMRDGRLHISSITVPEYSPLNQVLERTRITKLTFEFPRPTSNGIIHPEDFCDTGYQVQALKENCNTILTKGYNLSKVQFSYAPLKVGGYTSTLFSGVAGRANLTTKSRFGLDKSQQPKRTFLDEDYAPPGTDLILFLEKSYKQERVAQELIELLNSIRERKESRT